MDQGIIRFYFAAWRDRNRPQWSCRTKSKIELSADRDALCPEIYFVERKGGLSRAARLRWRKQIGIDCRVDLFARSHYLAPVDERVADESRQSRRAIAQERRIPAGPCTAGRWVYT